MEKVADKAQGPTRSERRAAITKFRETKLRSAWAQNGEAFVARNPEFSLFGRRLETLGVRAGPDGRLLFEPAYVLELESRIEKLALMVRELESKESTRVDSGERDGKA